MSTTRAAVLREMGRERPYSSSRPLSVEELELAAPGPGEVLVRVAAAGLCHSDLSVIDGSRPRPVPMVLGHEAAGVIEELGPGVLGFEPGDHVVFSFVPVCGQCVPCQSGHPALCEAGAQANAAGSLLSGARPFSAGGSALHQHLGVSAFSELTVASTASLVKIDPELDLQTAALFGCAVLTGVGAVVNTARAEPGASAAIFGLGGVGLSAVMGANLAGCHPIVAVDISDSKLELARELGATHTLKAGEETPAELRGLTGGGAAYVFEAVGNARVLAAAYASTRRGGKTVAIGLPHPDQRLELAAVTIVAEERQLVGSYMGSAVPRRDVPRLIALHRAGRLPVEKLFTRALRLSEVNDGFEALAAGEAVRQVVAFSG